MSEWEITEEQLLDLNAFLASEEDMLTVNLQTRTAQESKLFPMLPYLILTYLEHYYRVPDQIREASRHITPEEVGHRARNSTTSLNTLTGMMQLTEYMGGRSELIRLGVIRPEDNLEDLWLMVDWWKRFSAAYKRNDGHRYAIHAKDVAQVHDERVLQVFEADAWEADSALRQATAHFLAIATQYTFLAYCESRIGQHAAGPYNLGGQRLMHTRDFINVGESGLPWMDGIATPIPYNNLTVVLITDGVRVEVTDFGTAYTTPENYQDGVVGVGLYASDFLTDRYVPVGMDSRATLIETLGELASIMRAAITPLYQRFAAMSLTQLIEAGLQSYCYCMSEISYMAGTYDQDQYMSVDDRVRRFWPLFNEEYALSAYLSDFAVLDGKRGSCNDYFLNPYAYSQWRANDSGAALPAPGRSKEFVPAHVLIDHDYPRRANPGGLAAHRAASSNLEPKTGRWTVLQGRLTQDELNQAARDYKSPLVSGPWRNLDDTAVKWRWRDPEVEAMYRHTQETSRLLQGQGSGLLRADLEKLREAAGERAWSTVAPSAV